MLSRLWWVCLAASLACWAVAQQTWITSASAALTGVAVSPAAGQAMPLAAAAGLLVSRWLTGWGRRLVLLLVWVLLVACGPVALAATGIAADETGGSPVWPWSWVFLGLALLGAAAAAGAQLEPTPARGAPARAAGSAAPLTDWQSLDAGLDPSVETGDQSVGTPEWGDRATAD